MGDNNKVHYADRRESLGDMVIVAARADQNGSQSVDRALALLSLIGREPGHGVSLAELVDRSGISKPTVRRLLLALMRARLVEQEPEGRRYGLGEEAFVLGVLAGRRHGVLELAMESLRKLSADTQDTSFLTVRRDHFAVCLHREEGTYPVRTHALQAGQQHPLGVGAGSLAILAELADEEIASVVEANAALLERDYPGFAPAVLEDDVAETRRLGYALNPGRLVASSWGMGLAFRYPDGRIAGAFSLAAIDSRMLPERRAGLATLLVDEVRSMENRLARLFVSKTSADAPKRRSAET